MLGKLITVGLVLLALGAGYYLGMPDPEASLQNAETMAALEEERDRLAKRNEELEETLGLVKRQIQTDRIAYDNLQKTVAQSERDREQLLQRLNAQRELLDRLKQQIENQ